MNKEMDLRKIVENAKDQIRDLLLSLIRSSEFEKLDISPPVYIRNFNRRISLKEHESIINRNMLKELTFTEFFRDMRNPRILDKFIGRSLYLKGKGVGGKRGYRIFSENGWLHDEELSKNPERIHGDHIKVYLDPGEGRQFISVERDCNNRHIFILSGREPENSELVNSIVSRRKFPEFEGIASQRGWMPDSKSLFSIILREVDRP